MDEDLFGDADYEESADFYDPEDKGREELPSKDNIVKENVQKRPFDHTAIEIPNNSEIENYTRSTKRSHRTKCLLEKPVEDLIKELYDDEVKEQYDKQESIVAISHSKDMDLWVDKYAPRSFTDLLSDTRANRQVLMWLQTWNEQVKKQNGFKSNDSVSYAQRTTYYPSKGGKYEMPTSFNRALIITGPTGIGKTTLARIAAIHCGYEPIEVNASQDRSADTVLRRILDTTHMHSITGTRPKCLILDELDSVSGAHEKAGIRELVLRLTGKDAVRRPVICICNDLYAPALRELRQQSTIVRLLGPTSHALANRLLWICGQEGVQVPLSALEKLARDSRFDIRSCLNILQWNVVRSRLRSNSGSIQSNIVLQYCNPEIVTSLESCWSMIFSDVNVRNVGALRSSLLDQWDSLPKLVEGCFEQYLDLRMHDPTLFHLCNMANVFVDYDCGYSFVEKNVEYSLASMVAISVEELHTRKGNTFSQQLDRRPFPRVEFEQYRKWTEVTSMMRVWVHSFDRSVVRGESLKSARLDLLQPLMTVLSQEHSQWNPELMADTEKEKFNALINLHANYGVMYSMLEQDASSRGNSGTFSMVPPLDKDLLLIGRDSTADLDEKDRFIGRRVMAAELKLRKIYRANESGILSMREIHNSDGKKLNSTVSSIASMPVNGTAAGRKPDTNLPAKIASTPLDFFGRPIISVHPSSHNNSGGNAGPKNQESVWFKFHEGFTNAVRRVMYIRDFL